ncbi:hypothetical protein CDAR_84371 [Caerostris darwini]|uniref:Uncharacterized protein n=1 Tax=Caerostris darwini TaxID=1538125 RepID=A0AAV4X2E6_9ARAC|nr:hypothetical protein CDAR_84371 [Caerostris darwini]
MKIVSAVGLNEDTTIKEINGNWHPNFICGRFLSPRIVVNTHLICSAHGHPTAPPHQPVDSIRKLQFSFTVQIVLAHGHPAAPPHHPEDSIRKLRFSSTVQISLGTPVAFPKGTPDGNFLMNAIQQVFLPPQDGIKVFRKWNKGAHFNLLR